jgi:hypothetical protein
MHPCENYGGYQDRHESRADSNWHNSLHFLIWPEYGRVLVALFDKTWRQPKNQEAKGKRRDRATKRRQRET